MATALLVATLIYRGSQQIATAGSHFALRVGRGFLGAVHLILAPLVFVAAAIQLAGNALQESKTFFEADFDHSATSQVMVLAAPNQMAFYAGAVAQALKPLPTSGWHILSIADNDHRFTRTGAASFRLDVLGGVHGSYQELFRSPHKPLRSGDRVEVTGATVTVRAMSGLYPSSLDVTTDVPLEDPTLAILTWNGSRLVRFAAPPVGASVRLRSLEP